MGANKKAPAGTEARNSKLASNPINSAVQRQLIRQHLREVGAIGATTIELRHGLGVMHPGARIMELRRAGYDIHTRWDHDRTPDGVTHRVARYVLVREAGGAA